MKYAIVFPGQGSQSLRMLAELYDNFPIVRNIFEKASDILNLDLWQLSQTDKDALNQTINTQVIMLTANYAIYKVLNNELDLTPTCVVAGHSLGEYNALIAAKIISFTDCIKLVKVRAELMQTATPPNSSAMVAVLGLDDDKVIDICNNYNGAGIVEAVNFNAPGQVVIAGNKNAVASACATLKSAGAKRTLILPVNIASHCCLMDKILKEFATKVAITNFNKGSIDVIHNVDVKVATSIDDIKYKLVEQLHKPVLWAHTIRAIHDLGVVRIIESGPGRVLTVLTKRIEKSLTALATFDLTTLKNTIAELNKC